MANERGRGQTILGLFGDLGSAVISKMKGEGLEFGQIKVTRGTPKGPGRR